MGKVKLIVGIAFVAILSKVLHNIFSDHPLPPLPAGFYGSKALEGKTEDKKIYPFEIKIEDKVIQDFKLRLSEEIKSQRLAPPLEGINFEYGFNTKYLQKVVQYWHTKYDWRQREKLLNKYPQFKTKISGIDLHFQHVKPKVNPKYKETKPLLVLHGWPGSFVELQKIIPLLTEPQNSEFNFELIIPSLPGYGFSEGAHRPGLGPVEMSRIFLELMQRLGHEKFYIQGGDWGAVIVSHMATRYPENVIAMHSNLCFSQHPRYLPRMILSAFFPSFFMSAEEVPKFTPFSRALTFMVRETGYLHIQATKPDTVGVALSHSPSGLAAYILEKFSTWTKEAGIGKEDGGLGSLKISMDELLDNVMVYWVTNSITTSMRNYAENFSPREMDLLDRVPIKVPSACLQTGDPYTFQTEWILSDKYPNMVRYKMTNDGGHFMAMEEPKILADDVIEFVKQLQ